MPTDAIREAMATVRDYWGHKPVDRDRYNEAFQTLARWLVQHEGELVRLKGLEWEKASTNDTKWVSAATMFGRYLVSHHGWTAYNEAFFQTGSLKDAKAAAEAHYRARLAAALEPLFGEGGK